MLQAVFVHMNNVCGVCKSVRASVCTCACMCLCMKRIGSVHTCVWCSIFLLARSLRLSKSVFNCFTSLAVASNFTQSSSRESYSGSKYHAIHSIMCTHHRQLQSAEVLIFKGCWHNTIGGLGKAEA